MRHDEGDCDEPAATMTESRPEIPIAIRGLESPDLDLVFSSWLSTYRYSPSVRSIPNGRYFAGQHLRIERLIERGAVLLAVNPHDPAQVYGWCCTEGTENPAVHYVCVKSTYQRMGVASRLLAPLLGLVAEYTHRTGLVQELPIPRTWTYDPYRLDR